MYVWVVILLCVIALVIIAKILSRIYIKRVIEKFSHKVILLPSYVESMEAPQNGCEDFNSTEVVFINIGDEIRNVFHKQIISSSQEKRFSDYYLPLYKEACSVVKKIKLLKVTPHDVIDNFIQEFEAIHSVVIKHNEEVITNILERYKEFFDNCLKYPLDNQQRRSIVSEEDNCLVVSSAGSGKTSSIVGKVKYLIEVKKIDPKRILLISYTNKAASELTERMGISGMRGYTFHKLALDIIGQSTGEKPSICDNTDSLFVEIFNGLLKDECFNKALVGFLIDCQLNETDLDELKKEKREQLKEQKRTTIKAVFPDMDGRVIYVKSKQEQQICFVLSSLGVKFRYEEPYEYKLVDETHSQYKPDFSIYFEDKEGKQHRIYLEHFAIDERGCVPGWFAKDRGITYEEANQLYNDGITWKKAAHEKYNTTLLVTSSSDFHYYGIREKLKQLLFTANVPIKEKSDTELCNLVVPKGSKQEKTIIRLIATFVALIKTSCKTIPEVLKLANKANDERSAFMIENIFTPVYNEYVKALNSRGQIDFTDAIIQATEICRNERHNEYDYIIVDEFQDISIDRYNFLRALRMGTPEAKLYCVGDDWQSIYRFSGSDMSLFNKFSYFFGATEINKIETTYRFGEPLVSMSSSFIQNNSTQLKKNIHPFDIGAKTELEFYSYDDNTYCQVIADLISSIPLDKTIFLLGRYTFDDYYLSSMFQSEKRGDRFYYVINNRRIEFLTIHKSKGLEADYVILLQCNKDTHGFPTLINDDPVLDYVLTQSDKYPFGEERRLFYVAITRAKIKTMVLYDVRYPSVFVDEFLHPEEVIEECYNKHRNANKRWTRKADMFLLKLYKEGKSIKYISEKMGRSQTSISMRLNKLESS